MISTHPDAERDRLTLRAQLESIESLSISIENGVSSILDALVLKGDTVAEVCPMPPTADIPSYGARILEHLKTSNAQLIEVKLALGLEI